MEIIFPAQLWELYNLNPGEYRVSKPKSGHINRTFILLNTDVKKQSYVLQALNTQVFTHPEAIVHNISLAAEWLSQHEPDYLFIAPIANIAGEKASIIENEYWRLLPFVANTVALDVLSQTLQAFEAAKAFGKLTRYLAKIDPNSFQVTIPRFHDLSWRKEQFDAALSTAAPALKNTAMTAIQLAHQYAPIVEEFLAAKPLLPLRVVHHDTKISNVLLNEKTFEGVCVIDLDTLMPGYFISDLGDMMRTYLCACDENEKDLSKISIREDYFKAMMEGYLSEMGPVLSETEKKLLLFSGQYITYMQGLRFLTDFLQGSIYYPIQYPNHNLDRALNQFQLLKALFEKEKILNQLIKNYLS